MVAFQFSLVELQGFLLGSFCGVSHVAFMGFFDSKDGSNTSTTDEYLTEETASFLVFQSVDGENLLAVNIS